MTTRSAPCCIEALGNIGTAVQFSLCWRPRRHSWLLRFAVIEALAQLGSTDGLAIMLQREMDWDPGAHPSFPGTRILCWSGYERFDGKLACCFGKDRGCGAP